MANPYSLHKEWSPEVREAYMDMPKNSQGHVVSLLYLEGREKTRLEPLWREWCKRHPKHLWPEWIKRYAQEKNLGNRSTNKDTEVHGNTR